MRRLDKRALKKLYEMGACAGGMQALETFLAQQNVDPKVGVELTRALVQQFMETDSLRRGDIIWLIDQWLSDAGVGIVMSHWNTSYLSNSELACMFMDLAERRATRRGGRWL